MKRTCLGCRALRCEHGTHNPYKCSIGYEIERSVGTPLVQCPKPITIKELIYLSQLKDRYDLTLEELARWKFR